MSYAHYFILGIMVLIALVGFASFVYEVLPSKCHIFGKPIGRGGIDSLICFLGLASFLFGIWLLAFDTHGHRGLGFILVGSGFLVLCLVVFLRSRNLL